MRKPGWLRQGEQEGVGGVEGREEGGWIGGALWAWQGLLGKVGDSGGSEQGSNMDRLVLTSAPAPNMGSRAEAGIPVSSLQQTK